MDAIVTAALVGTAQQQKIDTTTGMPVDLLVEKLAESEAERKLLLSAGAWAVYRQAGRVAESMATAPEPAAPESLPVCSAAVASLLEDMLKGDHEELLPEALELLQHAGLRIPHTLLPTALGIQGTELRAAMFPVLGERGRWLSQFNAAWSWVAHYLPGTEDELLANAETTWQEGTPGQRQSILRLLRAIDPAKAREWLMAAWKQEKAEVRTELLGAFEIGLSLQDEEFLEKALDDRAASVRSSAASLLSRLVTSAFAKRMSERADAMLSYTGKSLSITLPGTLEKDWLRDGIITKAEYGVGEHTWWFTQVISLVPPTHWEERFGVPHDTLIAAAYASKEWHETLIASWSSAALLHTTPDWIISLWDWWCKKQRGSAELGLRASLLARMPQQEAEQRVLDIFSNPKHPGRKDWEEALAELPMPWSQEFGKAYLQELRAYISALAPKKNDAPYYDSWYQSISTAARALPAACFAPALERWVVPEASEDSNTHTSWQLDRWRQELKTFREAIRIRQRLIEEIIS